MIKSYRFAISCLLGHCCRFEPSCSTYAMDAINMHGCFKGCFLSMRRLLRCHPWQPGGLDPVPLAGKIQELDKTAKRKRIFHKLYRS